MAKSRMNAGDRKKAILEATLRVIARTNYDRATTARIAKEAGINEALIYHHFASKKELLLALLDSIRDDLFDILKTGEQKGEVSIPAFRAAGRYYQGMIEKDPDRIKALIKAGVVDDEDVREKVWEIIKSFHDRIQGKLEELQATGLFKANADLEMFAWALLAWGNLVTLTRVLGKGHELSDEKIDAWLIGLRQFVVSRVNAAPETASPKAARTAAAKPSGKHKATGRAAK